MKLSPTWPLRLGGLFRCDLYQQCTALPAPVNSVRLTIAALIALPVITGYGLHTAAAKLDQATRAQCAAQDWPVHQHAAHTAFCHTYLASNP